MGSHQLVKGKDGIYRITFAGAVDEEAAQAYYDEITAVFAEASEPILAILYVHQVAKISGAARRVFRQVGAQPMSGPTVILGTNRYLRVAATFVIRALGRNDVRVMETEETAVAWLKQSSTTATRPVGEQ